MRGRGSQGASELQSRSVQAVDRNGRRLAGAVARASATDGGQPLDAGRPGALRSAGALPKAAGILVGLRQGWLTLKRLING